MKMTIISELNQKDVQNNFECDEYAFNEGTLILKKNQKDIAYISTRNVKMILIDPIEINENVPETQVQSKADDGQ